MSRRPVMSTLAQTRARNRALRAEMARVAELVERKTREAILEGLLEGRIEDDGEIVIEGPPTATRRSPCR